MLFTVMGTFGLLTRVVYTIFEIKTNVNSILGFTVALGVGSVACFVCPLFKLYAALFTIAVVFGSYFAVTALTIPLIIFKVVSSVDHFESGLMMLGIFGAAGQYAGGPFAGKFIFT